MTPTGLHDALREQGGTLEALLTAAGDPSAADGTADPAAPALGAPALAAAGPRAAGHEAEYELLLEMILEGSLLHYAAPRVLRCPDPDLALLLGDQLYALGLSRLAELGDLAAIAELADLISLVAQAQAAGDVTLADAIWLAGAAAIGWGGAPRSAYEHAKALARAGAPGAAAALDQARVRMLSGRGEAGS